MNGKLKFAGAFAAGVMAVTAADAAGFHIREQSAAGQGMSFAGVAAGGIGLSGIFWNPAAVTEQSGIRSESGVAIILGKREVTVSSAVVGAANLAVTDGVAVYDIAVPAGVPAGYGSYQYNDKIWLGYGVNSPFGLATQAPNTWRGRYASTFSKIFTVNANPVVGLKLTPWLSIAAGAQIEYFKLNYQGMLYTGAVPTSGATDLQSVLIGDDTSLGYTAGATVTPREGTSIGVGFRSSVDHLLKGNAETYFPGGALRSVTPITGRIETPEIVTVGLRQRITDKVTLTGGAEWMNWSRLKELRAISVASGATVNLANLNYQDTWMFSAGGEYEYNENWLFRAGIAFDESPIPDADRSARLPDNDRIWLSTGATWTVNEYLGFNFGYTFVKFDDAPIALRGVGNNPTDLTATATGDTHIFAGSIKVKWGGEEEAAPYK